MFLTWFPSLHKIMVVEFHDRAVARSENLEGHVVMWWANVPPTPTLATALHDVTSQQVALVLKTILFHEYYKRRTTFDTLYIF